MKALFSKKEKLQEDDEIFFSLAPRDDVDEKDIYFNSFMQALKHKSKIIAFTGRYGIGKTSIINSILKKLDNQYEIAINDEQEAQSLLKNLVAKNIEIEKIEVKKPSLNDIFIEKVGDK